MNNAELLAFLFDEPSRKPDVAISRWIVESRRFRAFVAANKDKIRKKLRSARTPASMQSLLLELDIARRLLDDPRCEVQYEHYGQGRQRSPDLSLVFRGRTRINLEVTLAQMPSGNSAARIEKLMRIVCDKFGQSVPDMFNGVVVGAQNAPVTEAELAAAMKSLKRRVEHRDSDLLSRVDCAGPSCFLKRFQWLNAIVLLTPEPQMDSSTPVVWLNPQARIRLPHELCAMLRTLAISVPQELPLRSPNTTQTPCD